MTKQCDAPRCEATAKAGQLMCREHWFMLPKPMRDGIWETWRARDMRAYSANVLAARHHLAVKLGYVEAS